MRGSVRLLVSDRIHTPMAGGFRRPTVFLPVPAVDWSAECRDAVLAHELVHLARRDPLRHLTARLTLAMYWFHPAAWLAVRWAAIACEDACDEAVVRSGIPPSSYARVLLELAESTGRSRPALIALPIVQSSRLERRLRMILDHDTRRASTRRLAFPAAGCAVLAIAVAAARPSASMTPANSGAPDSGLTTNVVRRPDTLQVRRQDEPAPLQKVVEPKRRVAGRVAPSAGQRPEPRFDLPVLHQIKTVTLSPSYSCRSRAEFAKGYAQTALFLSDFARQRNGPDLLFNGACGAEDVFEAATAGDDMSLIADLGAGISLDDLSASQAFNVRRVAAFPAYSKFARVARIEQGHTYAVLLNASDKRGLFMLSVTEHVPGSKVTLRYAVKAYAVMPGGPISSPGFQWDRTNGR